MEDDFLQCDPSDTIDKFDVLLNTSELMTNQTVLNVDHAYQSMTVKNDSKMFEAESEAESDGMQSEALDDSVADEDYRPGSQSNDESSDGDSSCSDTRGAGETENATGPLFVDHEEEVETIEQREE